MLHLGRPTFNCSTNNVAESTGYLLLESPVGELAVREHGPADAIRGLYEGFLQTKCYEKKIGAKYLDYKGTDKAVQQHVIEREEAMHYIVSTKDRHYNSFAQTLQGSKGYIG
jgi:hypothetical protein